MPVKIILAGGGHALLSFLTSSAKLRPENVSITLISENPYLYYSGMIPEFLGGIYREEDIRIDLVHICKSSGIRFIKSRVTDIDKDRKFITTLDNKSYEYDLIAFDLGAVTSGKDIVPVSENLLSVRPLFRLTLVRSFLNEDIESKTICIIGGGAAGVEIAMNISGAHLTAIKTGKLRLGIYETESKLLPGFPNSVSNYCSSVLTMRGAEVHTGESIHYNKEGQIISAGEKPINADLVLRATGNAGPPLFSRAQLPVDPYGYLMVNPSLHVPDHPAIFAAGDCVCIDKYPDMAKIGIHAIKEGPVLAYNLMAASRRLIGGGPIVPSRYKIFRPYRVTPLILSTGGPEAIWATKKFAIRGRSALRLKHLLDRRWVNRYTPDVRWKSLKDLIKTAGH